MGVSEIDRCLTLDQPNNINGLIVDHIAFATALLPSAPTRATMNSRGMGSQRTEIRNRV